MFKRVGRPIIFILVLIIAAMSYLAIAGISYYNGDNKQIIVKGARDIRFGIDIKGGVDVTFKPPAGTKVSSSDMNAAVQRMNARLDSLGIMDRDVYPDYTQHTIEVRFPWKSGVKVANEDPETAIQELGAMSQLTFKGPDGSQILTGKQVSSATALPDQQNGGELVQLKLNSSGATAFANATKKYKGQSISIYMDDKNIETATVQEEIDDGVATITQDNGGMKIADAKTLANQINAGALPFKMITDNYSTISPSLGENALSVTLLAGMIAFILICLFMILYYRLPGFIACIALCGHIAGTILCISMFTLTLPGIAGIILSIGMGVDANVITAERIKEELRLGKTLDGAIDAGFERSFSAIFDGNVTVIIVGILLIIYGSGTVQSFGYTLVIGVVFNLLMGILFSRLMLKSISKFSGVRKNFLFGGVAK